MVFLSLEGYSQISLDFQTTVWNLYPVSLTNSETKYFENNQWNMNHQNQFSLYNLDGTFYKTIQMAPRPDTLSFFYSIDNITRTLFDNDPSNIEYIVNYMFSALVGPTNHTVRVIREDGTILLDELDAFTYGIYYTETGVKLRLDYEDTAGIWYQTKIFNLPGELPNSVKENLQLSTINPLLYPNPNNGSFYIRFNSNEGNNNVINLFSTDGKLIETYKSTGNMTHINNFSLSEGIYFLNTKSKNINSTSKLIIKK
jgi:hypothetical protein